VAPHLHAAHDGHQETGPVIAARGIRNLGLWTILTLLTLLTVYGFYERKLFAQEVWSRAGLERFVIFAAAYAVCFAAVSLWKPGIFLPAVLCFVVVYTIAAAGPLALLSVCLFLLSSLVLGLTLLGSDADAVLAMLLGISVYMFVVSIAVFAPVNYPVVYLLVLFVPLLWNHRTTIAWLAKIRSLFLPFPLASRMEQLALGALTFVLLAHWLVALEPEVGADALAMHLVVPSSIATFHHWAFDFKNHAWALMPMGGDWCYTVVYMFGGEPAARLLNFAFLLSIAVLLASRGSLLIAALFAATPIVQLVTGSLFVENLWALLSLGALISISLYRENRRAPYLYLTFILAGAAAATKFGALSFLVPFAALVFLTARPGIRRACAAIACFLIFAAPPYLTAFAKTGNPVYPFLSSTGPGSDARFQTPLTFHTPYDLTFHTSRFLEGQDGAAGFQYFLLLPAAVLLLGRKRSYLGVASALTFAISAVLIFAGNSNLRYLYPALPFAMLFMASALTAMRVVDVRLYKVVLALLAVVFCLDVYFLPSSGWYHKDFVLNPGRVTALAPVRNLVAYLNQAHPGAAAAFFETTAIAGLRGPAFTNTWHTPEFNNQIAAAQSAKDCLRLLHQYGAGFFVAPAPDSGISLTTTPVEVFLRNCTEPERRSGTFYVARLRKDNVCSEDQPGPPAPPGTYDDVDIRIVYTGAWTRRPFPEASHGTVTYSNAPGASFRFPFTGTEVTYVYTKAFNRGSAEILIDGASQGNVDLYSKSIIWQSTTRFQCKGRGPHLLEVRNKGSAFIDLDAIEVQ
jgi:hypothetical protein